MQYQLLLYSFFEELRKKMNQPLGVDNYYDLLKVLQEDISPDYLCRICQLLWLKTHSSKDIEVFKDTFKKYFEVYRDKKLNVDSPIKEQITNKANKESDENKIISPNEQEDISDNPNPKFSNKQQSLEELLKHENEHEESDENNERIHLTLGKGNLKQGTISSLAHSSIDEQEQSSSEAFLMGLEHLPIQIRTFEQQWRYLQRIAHKGILPEIDLVQTIKHISQQGIFDNLAYKPKKVNRVKLLILIDNSHSMIAFKTLIDEIVNSILASSYIKKKEYYYFNNYPLNYLYKDDNSLDAHLVNSILPTYGRETLILILSDAGAAKGGFNSDRIQLTNQFLTQCKNRSSQIVWLNPMPFNRWEGSSAEQISMLVPMFEITKNKLPKIIQSLRGKQNR